MTLQTVGKLLRNPVVVLDGRGAVVGRNTRAARMFGPHVHHWRDLFAEEGQLAALLARASGSGEPVLGALEVVVGTAEVRRCRAQALALRSDGTTTYAVEMRLDDEDQFAALNRQIRDLNHEVAVRVQAQVELEAALGRNQHLYRELQHRMKNQLQMMLALVAMTARESAAGERTALQAVHAKLTALLDAQRLMYLEDASPGVPGEELLMRLVDNVRSLAAPQTTFEVGAAPLLFPNDVAFPLALIANELLTGAARRTADRTEAHVTVALEGDAQEATLAVEDDGPVPAGPEGGPAASGLGLVRGLCRQIGGRLSLEVDDHRTRVAVAFPLHGS